MADRLTNNGAGAKELETNPPLVNTATTSESSTSNVGQADGIQRRADNVADTNILGNTGNFVPVDFQRVAAMLEAETQHGSNIIQPQINPVPRLARPADFDQDGGDASGPAAGGSLNIALMQQLSQQYQLQHLGLGNHNQPQNLIEAANLANTGETNGQPAQLFAPMMGAPPQHGVAETPTRPEPRLARPADFDQDRGEEASGQAAGRNINLALFLQAVQQQQQQLQSLGLGYNLNQPGQVIGPLANSGVNGAATGDNLNISALQALQAQPRQQLLSQLIGVINQLNQTGQVIGPLVNGATTGGVPNASAVIALQQHEMQQRQMQQSQYQQANNFNHLSLVNNTHAPPPADMIPASVMYHVHGQMKEMTENIAKTFGENMKEMVTLVRSNQTNAGPVSAPASTSQPVGNDHQASNAPNRIPAGTPIAQAATPGSIASQAVASQASSADSSRASTPSSAPSNAGPARRVRQGANPPPRGIRMCHKKKRYTVGNGLIWDAQAKKFTTYECGKCGEPFQHEYQLKKHYRAKHIEEDK